MQSFILFKITFFIVCFVSISATLTVWKPDSLVSQLTSNEIPVSLANFGRVSPGNAVRGRVYTVTSWNPPDNYSCSSLQNWIQINTFIEDTEYFPIVLIDKGNCSFVQMTRQVQRIGGYMALIINDTPGDISTIQLNDDGNGQDIQIISMWISKEVGDKIKDHLSRNPDDNIQLEFDFPLTKRETATVDIFMYIADEEAYSWWSEFREYYELIKDYMIFNPIYVTFPISGLSQDEKDKNCVSKGAYCIKSYMPNTYKVNGKELILDTLFHHCVFEESAKLNQTEVFFTFSQEYYSNCLYNKEFVQYCGNNVLPGKGWGKNEILQCIYKTFGVSTAIPGYLNMENNVLKVNYAKNWANNIRIIPTVFVNNVQMYGRLTGIDLFANICESLTNKPTECRTFKKDISQSNKWSWFWIWFIVIAVWVVNILIFLLCRKYIYRKIHERVETESFDLDGRINSVVSSYLTLKDPVGEGGKTNIQMTGI